MILQILPVSTLNAYIQQVITADEILADVWIEGEIRNLTRAKSGHIYFKISEGDAVIDGVMWRTIASRQTFVPQIGEAVVIHGRADFYPPQGRLQILADVFEHQGQGILALQTEQLRQQLEAEGLFDAARKRPLPRFPRRVGVVTSSTGAVWHDIQTVSRRRYPLVELVLVPAAVQGNHAPDEIVNAIRHLVELDTIDVLIVGRGGGAPEDLAPFNDEAVARAIFASQVPVVSAVGHETDVSIADMVADVRAATPSAAAELILPDMRELLQDLEDFRTVLMRTTERRISEASDRLARLQRRLTLYSPEVHITRGQQQLELLYRRLQSVAHAELHHRKRDLASREHLLSALHPRNVLERGFAVVEDTQTKDRIKQLADLPTNGEVTVCFHDGLASGTMQPDSSIQKATTHDSN